MDEHTLNDLLECSVCLERLDTSSKVLPCQHTFCRKCLEVIVSSRQELRCPECRVLVDVKIDDLPPNVLLMRILEGMKNAAAAKSQQQQKLNSSKSTNVEPQKLDPRHISESQKEQQKMQKQLQQQQQNQQRQHQHNLQQQLQAGTVTNLVNNGVHQFQQQQFAQQRRCLLPHAYALYDFESAEPSDLRFKKGDLVLLKRKIDTNWFVGQLNNGSGVVSEGTFPINHVQVVVPLPSPQCIALYDFKMPPNEEQGCLTFKKGTIIHVLRRVDHNWAEGCIGSTIGIFPIAFVELNSLAKQLLEGAYVLTSTPTSPLSTVPSTVDSLTVAAPTGGTITSAHAPKQLTNQLRNLPPIPLIDPTTYTNSSDSTTSSSSPSNPSSNTTSPHSVSTTTTTATNSANLGSGESSTSMPSSPNQSLPASPQHHITSSNIGSGSSSVRFRDKREKRHSLNALLSSGTLHVGSGTPPTLSILQSNRHSAEILSVPSDATNSTDIGWQPSGGGSGQEVSNTVNAAMPQTTVAREQQQQSHPQQPLQQHQQQQRVNVLKTSVLQQHVPPSLPWGYLALYPYKPRKSDELELKKGCVYIVTERCLDGWFKGKNWQDITGVFPGNYVTPLRNRDQQQLMHQWKYVPLQSTPPSLQVATTTMQSSTSSTQCHPAVIAGSQGIQNLHQPPDLPPRQVSGTLPISSVWTKPLGHTVEAFFNRHSKSNDNAKDNNSKQKDIVRQKENAVNVSTNAPTSSTASSSSTTSSAVQLMKRLAHIKSRSKSPSSALTQQQNSHVRQQQKSPQAQLSAEDTNQTVRDASNSNNSGGGVMHQSNSHFNAGNTHGQLQHPLHVRSGSCPSQLLQSLPHDLSVAASPVITTTTPTMSQINENGHKATKQSSQQKPQQQQQQQQYKQQISPQAIGYGAQQMNGSKERSQLQNTRQSIDAATLRSLYNDSVAQQQQQPYQQQAAKPLANKSTGIQAASEQQQQHISSNTIIANHRKSHSLDAAAALSAAIMPGTGCGGGGGGSGTGGGVVAALVAPCNITAAAVAASATTKSTQNSRESRFRCVVPYPPNSDIELELQVGDVIYVQRRQKNGWYKGTHARTNKTGLFPASFVEPDI